MIVQETILDPPLPTPSPLLEAEVSVRVSGVSKMYRIYNRPQDRLKQMLFWRFGKHYGREFWALRDVSFEIRKGEATAIVGRNGSGKSTLLQMIAGTLALTTGEIFVNGRVAALLELGSGFNPQFTGRENVFLKGAILGLSRQEIAQRFDDIVAFADIGDFIDQPVKLYSSGMFVRLAFAVATCVEPDVLLVDEALAVGDVFFRQKCYRRLAELRARGMSLVLVTHSMPDVVQYCQQAVVLDHGGMLFYGPASEAVKRYYLLEQHDRAPAAAQRLQPALPPQDAPLPQGADSAWPPSHAFLDLSNVSQVSNGWARCIGVAPCNSQGQPCRSFRQGETISIFYEFEMLRDVEVPIGGTVIQNDKGVLVHGKNTLQYDSAVPVEVSEGSRVCFRQDITLDIAVGEYTFEVGLATIGHDDYVDRAGFSSAELRNKITRLCHLPAAGTFAVLPRKDASVKPPHHGIADLPGECLVSIKPPLHLPIPN